MKLKGTVMSRKRNFVVVIFVMLLVNGCIEGERENFIRKSRNETLIVKKEKKAEDMPVKKLYEALELKGKLQYKIFQMAMKGFDTVSRPQKKYIAIIDFTQDSTKKRFFLIDIHNKEIVYNDLVAHGMNTGEKKARYFSNEEDSHMSSLGFYVTGEDYYGSKGYSLRLDGLDKGLNDNARKRAIVIHGASYVSELSIKEKNRIGRSWGCPALRPEINKDVIDKLKGGNLLFIYANNYEEKSTVLNGG